MSWAMRKFSRVTAVEVVAGQRFLRCEGDRVQQAVEAVPVLAEFDEQGVDFLVAADVAGEHQVGTEFLGQFGDAIPDALALVGEGEFGAFAFAWQRPRRRRWNGC